MPELIPPTFSLAVKISISDKDWMEVEAESKLHFSPCSRVKIESAINEYIIYAVADKESAGSGKVKKVLNSIIDSANSLLCELNSLFQFDADDEVVIRTIKSLRKKSIKELDEIAKEISRIEKIDRKERRKLGLGIRAKDGFPFQEREIAKDVIECTSESSFDNKVDLYKLKHDIREMVECVQLTLDSLPREKKGRSEKAHLNNLLCSLAHIFLDAGGKGINTKEDTYGKFVFTLREIMMRELRGCGLGSLFQDITHRDAKGLVSQTEDVIAGKRKKANGVSVK